MSWVEDQRRIVDNAITYANEIMGVDTFEDGGFSDSLGVHSIKHGDNVHSVAFIEAKIALIPHGAKGGIAEHTINYSGEPGRQAHSLATALVNAARHGAPHLV